jgi:alpha-glucosidase
LRNATKSTFHPVNSKPNEPGNTYPPVGYVRGLFEAPLQMLSDNPTAYMKEQECTDFIAKVPTTFDETLALDGKVASMLLLPGVKAIHGLLVQ